MSQPRKFIDEGVSDCTSKCKSTGMKFHLRMQDKLHGKVAILSEDGEPLDSWYLSREEMKTLFRVLSKPCQE